jgi:hypothetical protein
VGACACCAAQLRLHRAMRGMISNVDLRFLAPPGLRTRLKALPVGAQARRTGVLCSRASCSDPRCRQPRQRSS